MQAVQVNRRVRMAEGLARLVVGWLRGVRPEIRHAVQKRPKRRSQGVSLNPYRVYRRTRR